MVSDATASPIQSNPAVATGSRQPGSLPSVARSALKSPPSVDDVATLRQAVARWRAVALLAILAAALGPWLVGEWHGPPATDPLATEATTLDAELDLADLRLRVARMELAQERARRLENKLRAMARAGAPGTADVAPPSPEAVAADLDEEIRTMARLSLSQVDPALRLTLARLLDLKGRDAFAKRIDDLLAEAQRRELSLAELYDHLRRRKDRLSSYPGVWPCRGWLVSGFGYRMHPLTRRTAFHQGVDIAGPTGTPIVATADGTVVVAEERRGYGLTVVVDHHNGLSTLYAHLLALRTSRGARVLRGEVVGLMGSTGHSTGPHVHYEVRVRGIPDDPLKYVFE